ncbi:MAG: AAA family ATPase [Planctomycetales bacterium]|nr:AAA family ATPase [Planctomycetales bacterium]
MFSIAFDAVDAATPLRQFIGGEENLLVQTACHDSLSESPRFSPLVFFGPPGTGKSLLAEGLLRTWSSRRQGDEAQVTAITGADFARAYSHAVQTDSLDDLRERWRHSRRFFIDDVQTLATKSAAQHELAQLIDELSERNVVVLATMSTLPSEADGLATSLVSRLSGGLTVPVAPPGRDARRHIAGELARLYDLDMSEDSIDLLVDGDPSPFATAPELQHALSQLMLLSEQRHQPITPALVRTMLESTPPEQPSLRTICQITAKHFQVKSADLRGSSRRQSIAHARSVAMYLCRELTDSSFEQIGKFFGKRDHTTVMHACRQAVRRRAKDVAVDADCTLLLKKLTGAG